MIGCWLLRHRRICGSRDWSRGTIYLSLSLPLPTLLWILQLPVYAMRLPWSLLLPSTLWSSATANVEKTIFLGPTSATIPSTESGLDDLGLERLSPLKPSTRTELNASFPTHDTPEGTESWYFLENLMPGQRYEVRICYLATVCIYIPGCFITTYPTNQPATNLFHSFNIHSSPSNGGSFPPLLCQPVLGSTAGRCADGLYSPESRATKW